MGILMFNIIAVLIIGFVIYRFLIKDKLNNKIINRNVDYDYVANKPMTKSELVIYNDIKSIIANSDILLSQVRLVELVGVDTKKHKYKSSGWYKRFNKLSRKHIDFVILDSDGNVKKVIELNDFTHRNDNRINRDIEVKNIFKSIGVELITIDFNDRIKLKDIILKDEKK